MGILIWECISNTLFTSINLLNNCCRNKNIKKNIKKKTNKRKKERKEGKMNIYINITKKKIELWEYENIKKI